MRNFLLKIFFGFVLVFIVSNLILLDYFWFRQAGEEPEKSVVAISSPPTVGGGDFCGQSCQETIAAKVKEELKKITPSVGQSSISQPTTVPQAKFIYIPLVSSGSTVSTSWTVVPGSDFYFDLASYSGVKEIRFEARLKALQGAAKVFARLYDETNHRGVDYSDLETQTADFTRKESSPVSIWRGNNQYQVQLRSVNGTETEIKDAKLKIIY